MSLLGKNKHNTYGYHYQWRRNPLFPTSYILNQHHVYLQSNLWSQYLTFTLLLGVLQKENTTSIYKPSNVHLLLPCCRAPPVWTAWGNDAYWLHFQSAAWQSPLCPELRHPASPAPGSRSKAGEDTHVNNRINTKNMPQILFSMILLLLLILWYIIIYTTICPLLNLSPRTHPELAPLLKLPVKADCICSDFPS